MKNKKGLSAIIASLIIILLAIIAFAIVSVVVKNTITKGSEGIELSGKCLEVDIKAVKIARSKDEAGNEIPQTWAITISRSASGSFPVDGVDLTFTDAQDENSVTKEKIKENIKPLEKFTKNVEVAEFTPAKVTVVPYFLKENGAVHYCENIQTTIIE